MSTCQIFLFTPSSCHHWDSNIKNLTSCHNDLTKYLQYYMYVTKNMIIFSFLWFPRKFFWKPVAVGTTSNTTPDTWVREKQKPDGWRKVEKNSFWTLVTKKLSEEGYDFTQEQISGRWKTLCRNYKAVKDGNKK